MPDDRWFCKFKTAICKFARVKVHKGNEVEDVDILGPDEKNV